MGKLLTILFIGLIFEAIGVVLLSRGLVEILWLLSPREILHPQLLASKLSTHSEPLTRHLWDHFSPQDQQALSNPATSPALRQSTLVRVLNHAFEEPLYERDRFAGVPLSSETEDLLSDRPQGNERIQLNRLLLQDAFPSTFARQQDRKTNLREIAQLFGRGITNAHVVAGVFFEALFFVSLLMLMSRAEVSFVWPLTSLSFVVTTIAAKIYLKEQVAPLRWSGVCLIMLGAALISWTEKSKDSARRQPERLSNPSPAALPPQKLP